MSDTRNDVEKEEVIAWFGPQPKQTIPHSKQREWHVDPRHPLRAAVPADVQRRHWASWLGLRRAAQKNWTITAKRDHRPGVAEARTDIVEGP